MGGKDLGSSRMLRPLCWGADRPLLTSDEKARNEQEVIVAGRKNAFSQE